MIVNMLMAGLIAVSSPGGIEELVYAGPIATATVGATRTGNTVQLVETLPPPPVIPTGLNGMPFAPEGLSDCDEMSFYRVQAGLPSVFQGIGWRESNCRNEEGVHTSCCWGYWQFHRLHINGSGYIYGKWCDVRTVWDLNGDDPLDKQRQACAVKALYDEDGLSPWAATT